MDLFELITYDWLDFVTIRIPRDIDQRNIWLDLLDLPATANARVCSKHFEPSDFDVKMDGHVWLKRFSCPKQIQLDRFDDYNRSKIRASGPLRYNENGSKHEVSFF